jgi:enamine deaminase RidA (YjgF/YER057c/UK114 family)/nitrite reductase/ring-hydroxylating ferredoxin subunit
MKLQNSKSVPRKRSIHLEGIVHNAPIPMAARVGNMVFSSGIMGVDPSTGTLPADGVSEVKHAFSNMKAILAKAGATLEHVGYVKIYLKDPTLRDAINKEWVECFPDPEDRPARHTLNWELSSGMRLQLEITAIITE